MRTWTTSRAAAALALAAATLLFTLPLLSHSALPFGSDLGFASHSARGFVQGLREGILYPRWVENSNRGFGGPTFFFYSPLPYYAVGAASLVTRDILAALRLVLIAASFLAGLSFYISTRRILSAWSALAGAVLYLLLPYHALDLYDRFAFAEFCSFIWFPPLFVLSRRLLAGPSPAAWVRFVFCFTLLILTHLVTAYMVLLVLAPYVLVHLMFHRRWRRLPVLAGGVGMALACSGIFLIPMLHQRPLVHLDWIVNSSYGDWHRNFVYRDEVAHGFTAAHIKPFVNRTATTQAIIALAALALLFLRDKAGGSKSLRDGPAGRESLAWMAVAVWTFFLQIPPSTPLWSTVPELGTIQFPWRFGLFQSLSCAFLMASVSAVFGPADSRGEHVPSPGPGQNARHGWVRQPATGIALLFLASLPALVVSAGLTGNSEFLFDAKIAQDPRVDSRVMEEYLSRTFQGWQKFKQAPFALHAGPVFRRPARWQEEGREPGVRLMRVISKEPNTLHLATILYPGWRVMVDGRQTPVREAAGRTGIAVDLPAGSHLVRLEFMRARLAGPGQLKTLLWGTEERQFQVEAPQKNRLDLRIFYHPGWKAWIDGKETLLRHDNVMNAIQVPVPSGRHQVRVALTATQDRWMGAVVSSVALATMLALAGVLAWRQRKTS